MKAKNFLGRKSIDNIAFYHTNEGNKVTLYLTHQIYPEDFYYSYVLTRGSNIIGIYLAGYTFEEAVETCNILIEYM